MTRGGEVVSCEAHKILWRGMVTFRGKLSKLLGTPVFRKSGTISSQAPTPNKDKSPLATNWQGQSLLGVGEGSETIMGATHISLMCADGIVHSIW